MSAPLHSQLYDQGTETPQRSSGVDVVRDAGAKAAGFSNLEFRRTLGRFATGVTVVSMLVRDETQSRGEEPAQERAFGITVNAFMSVSLEPALIAISIDKSAHAHATLLSSARFGVSVLAEDQRDLSDLFAGRRSDPGLEPFSQMAGFPVIDGAVARLVCRMYQSIEAGDHTIFLGEVEALDNREGSPLIFHAGRYDQLG